VPSDPAFRELAVRQLMQQASAKTALAEFGEAGRLLHQAAGLAPDAGDPILVGFLELQMGNLRGLMEDPGGADQHYRKALEMRGWSGRPVFSGPMRQGVWASICLHSSRFDEGRCPGIEQALALAEKAGSQDFPSHPCWAKSGSQLL